MNLQAGDRGYANRVTVVAARLWALALLATFALPVAATGLFDDETELAIVLEFPVREMLRHKEAKKPLPATLHYVDETGQRISLPLQVRARGNTRLQICVFPPIRLDFKSKESAGTLFAGFPKLKAVTQCKRSRRYADYVRLEQSIYRIFNVLTPVSFRTRMLSISYRDTDGWIAPFTAAAFLIEEIDDVAARNDMRLIRRRHLDVADVNAAETNLLELFQYLVGNTDWSAYHPSDGRDECCHNGRTLQPEGVSGGVVLVPFDFDYAGLVNANYAVPHPKLHISSVRKRVYRGVCANNGHVAASIERLRQARARIEALFSGGGLSSRARQSALSYIESFYDIIEDEHEVKRRIYDDCRPES